MGLLALLGALILGAIFLVYALKAIFWIVTSVVIVVGGVLYGLCLLGFCIGTVILFLLYQATSNFALSLICAAIAGFGVPILLGLGIKNEVCRFGRKLKGD